MSSKVVPLDEWGRHLLEELLFRAAERVGAASETNELAITLTFTLRADVESGCIEISVPGSGGSELLTHLPRPF